MRYFFFLVLFHSFTFLYSQTDTLEFSGEVYLESKKNLVNEKIEVFIWMDGNSILIKKEITINEDINLFKFKIPLKSDFIRVQFEAPNHKMYTKNIIVRDSHIALNKISLKYQNVPRIESIIYSWEDSLSAIFKISVFNPNKYPLLISEIQLLTKKRISERIKCNSPKRFRLKINDKIKIDTSKQIFTESSIDNSNFLVFGHYDHNLCSGLSELFLKCPIENIIVKPESYFHFEVELPNTISLEAIEYENYDSSNLPEFSKINDYKYFTFELISTNTEKLLIKKTLEVELHKFKN